MKFQTSGSAKVKAVSCCLLFDPKIGSIQHVHRVVTMEGAPDTSKADLEAQTLKLAKDLGLDTGKLQVLHVDESAIAEPAHYAVDPKSRTLVKQKPKAVAGPLRAAIAKG
jgi:hypothetical protein